MEKGREGGKSPCSPRFCRSSRVSKAVRSRLKPNIPIMARRDGVLEALARSPLLQQFWAPARHINFFYCAFCLTLTLLEAVNGCALLPPPSPVYMPWVEDAELSPALHCTLCLSPSPALGSPGHNSPFLSEMIPRMPCQRLVKYMCVCVNLWAKKNK